MVEVERLRRENERLREDNAEQAKRNQGARTPARPAAAEFHGHLEAALVGWSGLRAAARAWASRDEFAGRGGGSRGIRATLHRPLVPAARVDTVITLAPDRCRRCADRLHADACRG